jgi:tRNA pseudouridine32 synthase / 23S rRNA pseudouridine746 synthase
VTPCPSDADIAGAEALTLLHADASLLAFDKPAGLLCVPGRGTDKQDCLATRAQVCWPDALVVHRLDMATSGIVLMARGALAQRLLSIAFARRETEKTYVAIVHGQIADDSGEIDLPLAADWPNRPLQKVDLAQGKASLTRYRVLQRHAASNTTRVELQPITGRSHQLRVHLLALGHPILGDALYAPSAVQAAAPRLLLHAQSLRLLHPANGAPVSLECASPF